MTGPLHERCVAVVDLAAIDHNVRALRACAPSAVLCAVVKGDGYGHGAVAVARAALGAGAHWLGVACAAEGAQLRLAGVDAPVLVLAEPPPADLSAVVEHDLRAVVYTAATLEALGELARARRARARVHLKVDTGMHRAGCRPEDAVHLATVAAGHPALELEGVMTHLATADEPGSAEVGAQLSRFDAVLGRLAASGLRPPVAHAANSAGVLAHPASHLDLVRPGIAVYGLGPLTSLAGGGRLRPALSLHARVSRVQRVPAGDGVSYGLRWQAPADTVVATVSIGYADGVRRALGLRGADVLVGGRRRPMVGVVTMDQLMVDCGPGAHVAVGDTVTLIGDQGGEHVGAGEWAAHLDTIDYEVVAAVGPRVPRRYVGARPG